MRQVNVLGSTGSIGTQTLDLIRDRPDDFAVAALAAGGSQAALLIEQCREFHPTLVAVADLDAAKAVQEALPELTVVSGQDGILQAAVAPCDVVINAITGAVGLRATLATLNAGLQLGLANKESLVIGGKLVMDAAKPGQIIAVDSEHSAFAQALRAGRADEVKRLILTASGGPFRGRHRDDLAEVTVAQALAHPTWSMGRVITINSATLVNKGLELIEAALLYDIDYDAIQVVVHPQSAVHSAVEFVDGSTMAQCSPPDMKLPISLALDQPRRIPDAAAGFDWQQAQTWTFEPLDDETFPAVELARIAGKAGGTAPAVFN
ncbi:MAG: 1-deoxy-D-xylulose-5-phosphate reductoisomerase, partial [Propionibacteriaceae bacterium]